MNFQKQNVSYMSGSVSNSFQSSEQHRGAMRIVDRDRRRDRETMPVARLSMSPAPYSPLDRPDHRFRLSNELSSVLSPIPSIRIVHSNRCTDLSFSVTIPTRSGQRSRHRLGIQNKHGYRMSVNSVTQSRSHPSSVVGESPEHCVECIKYLFSEPFAVIVPSERTCSVSL